MYPMNKIAGSHIISVFFVIGKNYDGFQARRIDGKVFIPFSF